MKKKLIAMLLTTTIIGGAGVTTYAATEDAVVIQANSDYSTKEVSKNNHYLKLTNTSEVKENSTDKVGFVQYVYISIRDIINRLNEFMENILNGDNNEQCPDVGDGNVNSKPNNGQDNIVNKPSNKPNDNNVGNSESNGNNTGNVGSNEGNVGTSTEEKPPIVNTPSENEKPQVPPAVETPPTTEEEKPPVVEIPETPNSSDKFMAEVETLIIQKVNEERSKAGLSSLKDNKTMEKYARIKSQDMGDRGYFDHNDPEGNLITVQMQKDGVSYNAWGENIAYVGGTSGASSLANQFMNMWMNSQGHRANILSSNFTDIGVGVYKIGNTVYATQEFYR